MVECLGWANKTSEDPIIQGRSFLSHSKQPARCESGKHRPEAWLDGQADSSNTEREQRTWSKIWKVEVPSKLKIFLWRLAQQVLPTADLFHHRHMSPVSNCCQCGSEDSWRHSLLECTMSRCVWALADSDLVELLNRTSEPDAKTWIFSLMDSIQHADFGTLLVTLWAIWNA